MRQAVAQACQSISSDVFGRNEYNIFVDVWMIWGIVVAFMPKDENNKAC